jgi:hypothetical protein
LPDSESDYGWARASRLCTPASTGVNPGNPRGRSAKNLPARLADALNEMVYVTIDGRLRNITQRAPMVTQMVNKSAGADLRATKMLIDTIKDVEQRLRLLQIERVKTPAESLVDRPEQLRANGLNVFHSFRIHELKRRRRYASVVIHDNIVQDGIPSQSSAPVKGFKGEERHGLPTAAMRRRVCDTLVCLSG